MSWRRAMLIVVLAGLWGAGGCRQDATPGENAAPSNTVANNNVPEGATPADTAAPPASNTNVPVTSAASPATNPEAPTGRGQPIPSREPEQYRATLTIKCANRMTLTADVARNGTDRRLDFKLPDGTKLIYLYQTDRLFLILPDKKVYAEQEGPAGRFTLPSTLDPERLTQQLRADHRYEAVGEEKFQNRTAAKYRYVDNAQSFVYVDKELGLPLHVEMGQTAPGTGAFIPTTIELSGLTTDLPLKYFNEPRDMQQVELTQAQEIFNRVMQAAAGVTAKSKNAAP